VAVDNAMWTKMPVKGFGAMFMEHVILFF
jgi:hypothetical protein